ncbi:MAG: type II secretion system F family protein [Dehalococcoidia bacterium]
MILIAAATAALAAFIAVYALSTPGRPSSVNSRLGRFDRNTARDREAMLAAPFVARVGTPVVGRIQSAVRHLLPGSLVSSIETRLIAAGEPISLHAFLVFQLVMAGLAVLTGWVVLTSDLSGIPLILGIVFPFFVAAVPIYWLRLRVSARRLSMVRAMPDAVDLIVTTVEAGLAIDAALAEVGHETKGPLGEELRLTVRETTLGRSRRDALIRLIERAQVPELKTFVQSIIQAEQTGIPIGQVLRTQADQIRVRRRQRAEAAAQRAPIKMILVLVFFILPAMLATILGPAFMKMQDAI